METHHSEELFSPSQDSTLSNPPSPKTLIGSPQFPQHEAQDDLSLAPMSQNRTGSIPQDDNLDVSLSCLLSGGDMDEDRSESFGEQFWDSAVQSLVEDPGGKPSSQSSLVDGLNSMIWEPNSLWESSWTSQCSASSSSSWSPWPSSSSTKHSSHSSEQFPIKESKLNMGAGINNLGNTCYLNAILQCFMHTVPLVEGLRSSNHPWPCDSASKGLCVLCALREHVGLSIASSGWALSPTKLVDNLNHLSSDFRRHQQEDAHEFLQCFLDKLRRCWLDSDKKNETPFCKEKNLVERVFGGSLISKLQCCSCGYCSEAREPFIDLSLVIEDVNSLPMALESFTKVEKLNDLDTKLMCENCKEQVSMKKQLAVDRAPPIAAFHLKRFKSVKNIVSKIDKHVEFPLVLNLRPYTSGNNCDVELKYELYAIVEHTGIASTSGHYVCFIRSSPDTWHRLDDSEVTRVRQEFVLSQEAYILFYARQGIPWFSSLMEGQMLCSDLPIMNSSPKSDLDNVENICTVYNYERCTPNAPRDGGQKFSTYSCREGHGEVLVSDATVAADGLSVKNDGFKHDAGEFEETNDSTPMITASITDDTGKCFAGASHNEGNICSISSPGGNDVYKWVDEVRNAGSLPITL